MILFLDCCCDDIRTDGALNAEPTVTGRMILRFIVIAHIRISMVEQSATSLIYSFFVVFASPPC